MSELTNKYYELRRQIAAKQAEIEGLEGEMKALIEAMPMLYCVVGNGMKELSKGIHFAGYSSQACVDWLLDSYPEMKMLNEKQFSSTAIHHVLPNGEDYWIEDNYCDGRIKGVSPINSEDWAIAMAFLK